METNIAELQALQNAANSINLNIKERLQEDKRKRVKLYFAMRCGETVSPNLNYDQMNHFLLGWIKCIERIANK